MTGSFTRYRNLSNRLRCRGRGRISALTLSLTLLERRREHRSCLKMVSYWRQAGLSYIRYSAICAQAVRQQHDLACFGVLDGASWL
ncbi:hypothetical protein AOXY_G26461 [Acipenser oxyrinchus oxyrinchus]|uniref:Uncharacterized protein n=1 Tax=Acipenser oxyrinchus oxyrinchus TaxID=40147 RepID=A0AAD8CRE2_ACIOX|nr:hypothetical protein AOXY_G26461 [Acipenser oxyrinchus oxyrinchus]